jgi:hypothetical protein
MPKKGEGKGKRVTTTNIKVTVEAHRELQVAADMLDVTQSEVISKALRALLPNLPEEVSRREELKRQASERAASSNEKSSKQN